MLKNESEFLKTVEEDLKAIDATFSKQSLKRDEYIKSKNEQLKTCKNAELLMAYSKLTGQLDENMLDMIIKTEDISSICQYYSKLHTHILKLYADDMRYAKLGNHDAEIAAKEIEEHIRFLDEEVYTAVMRQIQEKPITEKEIDQVIDLCYELDSLEELQYEMSKFYLKNERKHLYGIDRSTNPIADLFNKEVVAKFGSVEQNNTMLKRTLKLDAGLLKDAFNPNAVAIYDRGTSADVIKMLKTYQLYMNPTYFSQKIKSDSIEINMEYAKINSEEELDHYQICLGKTSEPKYKQNIARIKRRMERELPSRERKGLSEEDEKVYAAYGIKTFKARKNNFDMK